MPANKPNRPDYNLLHDYSKDTELTAEEKELLREHNARELTQKEKLKVLTYIARGGMVDKLASLVRTNEQSIWYTLRVDKEFARKYAVIRETRCEEVEQELVRGAFGKHKTVKNSYVAKIDPSTGEIEVDRDGKPVLVRTKKEVTHHPPSESALMFYLKGNSPKFATKNKTVTAAGKDVLSPEDMKLFLRDKIEKHGRKHDGN